LELELGAIDQLTEVPEVKAEAQETFEVAGAKEQSAGLGVTRIVPVDETAPTSKVEVLSE
jgi:hypothetical protein